VDPAIETSGGYVLLAAYVHPWLVTGDPPVQPDGDDVRTVRVCVLSGWHAPHAE